MKRNLLYILAVVGMCFGVASCMPEDIVNDTHIARHQVEGLVATPGDEEVTLSWTLPEGWNPTDFLISYNDADAQPVKLYTDGAKTFVVGNLINEFSYEFNVQAIYGKAISGAVSATGKPTTSRFPILNVLVDSGDQYVMFTWEKPSTLVESYTVQYYMEGDESNVHTETIDKDALSYEIKNLTNDKNYTFSVVANYAKGASEAYSFKAMPALAIPYFVSATSVAQGWPVDYKFNRADFPGATDVKWTFPDGAVKTGDEVTYGVYAIGTKEVILNATVNGIHKVWKIELNLREWVVGYGHSDWDLRGKSYAGFRGSYPVLSPDGNTVYALPVMNFTALYAFDVITGEKKWHYNPDITAAGYNPPTVNHVTGDIYFGTATGGQFYCVTPEGTLRWQFTEAGAMKAAAPAVSVDGKIVVICDQSGNAFGIDAVSGQKKWSVALGAQSAGIVVNGNEVAIAIKDTAKSIHFLNITDGSSLGTISITAAKNGPTEMTGFAVADDKKTAYIPLSGGNSNPQGSGMAKIDLSTHTLIKEAAFADNDCYAPVVASNGYIIVGSKDGLVYAVDSEFNVKWKFNHAGETPVASSLNYSHICADASGRAYVVCGKSGAGHKVYILNVATGEVVDSYQYSAEMKSYAMCGGMFHNGVYYYGTASGGAGCGDFFGKYVGGTDKFWGGPGGDICGSGCIQSATY